MPGDGFARRAVMYGENDLSSCSLFAGSYINFGFWKHLSCGATVSIEQRIKSQADMYRAALIHLGLQAGDRVLEVGCGVGVGGALALTEFEPLEVHGVDISPAQVARANQVNAELLQRQPGKLVFQEGSALALPYPDGSFDRVFSIEAAQHFENLVGFVREAYRVLKPGGSLAVATFFTPREGVVGELTQLIETVQNGIDVVVPVGSFHRDLIREGFSRAEVESIGKYVWYGFDAWMSQTEFKQSWGRNWLRAYEQGLIDYYIVTAT